MTDNTTPAPKKKARPMFRVNIIYTGKKYAGKVGCAFIKANSKDEAGTFVEKSIKDELDKTGLKNETFKIEVTPSSKDEVDFYVETKKTNFYYSGIVN